MKVLTTAAAIDQGYLMKMKLYTKSGRIETVMMRQSMTGL